MTSEERTKIRQALENGLPDGPLTEPGTFLCHLTIDGLDRVDRSSWDESTPADLPGT
jgi:hypothetical protein